MELREKWESDLTDKDQLKTVSWNALMKSSIQLVARKRKSSTFVTPYIKPPKKQRKSAAKTVDYIVLKKKV